MTNETMTGYIAFLLVVGVLIGATTIQASEVTGTLSSDAASNLQTSGNLSGTVSSESGGGGGSSGSSGGSRSSRNTDAPNEPAGEVLGAATNVTAPSFPNAGFAPTETKVIPTLWSTIRSFFSAMTTSIF